MSIKPVVRMGNPQLATASKPVTDFSGPKLKILLENMLDTMKEKRGVGIAAPQIGYNLRVVMFGFDKSERYPNEAAVPFTILINPTIEILSTDTVDGWEGCLSVPGLRGIVPRYVKIKYSGYDEKGNLFSRIAENFHARVVQHEVDHLDGILFPHRMKDMQSFGFEEEMWDKIYNKKI